MPSSPRSPALALALALLALAGCAGTPPAAARYAAGSLCRDDERSAFQCPLEHGAVALCARFDGARITTLSLRSGDPSSRVDELAAPAGGNFQAQSQVLAPAAQLNELWFASDATTTALGQCIGGDCVSEAGLSVLRDGRLVSHLACQRGAGAQPWFADWLLRFGDGGAAGSSATPLIVFGGAEHPLASRYIGEISPR